MLLTRYFCFVGGALFALLLLVAWYSPGQPPRSDEQDASSAVADSIRIRSAQRWPDKVVIDTSVPIIVPPPAPPAPILAQAANPPADTASSAARSPVEARAELKPEPPARSHRRIARVRHRSPRPRASEFASAGPPMAPSWPFGW